MTNPNGTLGGPMRPIVIKKSHKGLLHQDMGIPQGQGISLAQLQGAKQTADPAEDKRIQFAENMRGK